MRFCDICQNMMYLSDTDNKLKLYCKNCNFTTIEQSTDEESINVATKKVGIDTQNYKSYMTPNIVFDVTLPRVNNIKCPKCSPEKNEVIYVKYDHDNMKYLYCCCNCRAFWKN